MLSNYKHEVKALNYCFDKFLGVGGFTFILLRCWKNLHVHAL